MTEPMRSNAELAYIDDLTGLYNRRYLKFVLPQELTKAIIFEPPKVHRRYIKCLLLRFGNCEFPPKARARRCFVAGICLRHDICHSPACRRQGFGHCGIKTRMTSDNIQ